MPIELVWIGAVMAAATGTLIYSLIRRETPAEQQEFRQPGTEKLVRR